MPQQNKRRRRRVGILSDFRYLRRWQRVTLFLSVFVLIGTLSALILPAVTQNRLICGLEEHTHGEGCYSVTTKACLVCTPEVHSHTPSCYDADETLICGLADYIVHTHDSQCYDADGTMICTLEEIKEHRHGDACYQVPETVIDAGHTHGDACYAWSVGETRICDAEDDPAHVHDETCCEQLRGELLCTEAERDPLIETGEPVLICTEPPAVVHKHTADCPGEREEAILTCEVPEHTHTASCREPLPLTEEELLQVDTVISAIRDLPVIDDVRQKVDDCDTPEGYERRLQVLADVTEDLEAVLSLYRGLNGLQQNSVTNRGTLSDLSAFITIENNKDAERAQAEVNRVIQLIDALPSLQSAKDDHASMESTARDAYTAALSDEITPIRNDYKQLRIAQKAEVTNADKLLDYVDWLKEIGILPTNEYEVMHYTDATYTQVRDDHIALSVQGDLPEGAEVRAFPVQIESSGEDLICAYDINVFLPDGSVYELENPVRVTVSGFSSQEDADIVVMHVDEAGTRERMESEWDGNAVSFTATHFSVYAVADASPLRSLAEPGDPEAMQALADSGFFNYWSSAVAMESTPMLLTSTYPTTPEIPLLLSNSQPSDEQIVSSGGDKTDGDVTVSKTAVGTDVENVFDITLTMDTTTNITELQKDPDMAIVIVMDISNTMTASFSGSTRYKSAILAAESFLDTFAAANNGYSRVGFVAFNTDAHEIFGLSECSTTEQATALKNTMRTATGNIINASGYATSYKRYTNIESGLKRGYDMLAEVSNTNKYIIFLSDGFPTTYQNRNVSGYIGYSPYSYSGTKGADGVFYDFVKKIYCDSGTSYSDKGAIRAREMATQIKDMGAKIFSIGVDIGGQTISGYERSDGISVLDRTSTTYELGSATATNAFKNWLRNSIGSGYYYDSTDTSGLHEAYAQIFAKIKELTEEANRLKWIASDPIPEEFEFVGFYNLQQELQVYEPITNLVGSGEPHGENMISYDPETRSIAWNLKQSGYTSVTAADTTWYTYQVRYRVRLRNELDGFAEHQSYNTNGRTTLTYQKVTTVDGNETISGDKTVEFPIPAVKGYLGELTFKKVSNTGGVLQGAEFELRHDETVCDHCRGDGSTYVAAVEETVFHATSGTDGIVTFAQIPSGHTYHLVETKYPDGHFSDGSIYTVTVAYDEITVERIADDGVATRWDLTSGTPELVNQAGAILPSTGGPGTTLYIFCGTALLLLALTLIYGKTRRNPYERGAR